MPFSHRQTLEDQTIRETVQDDAGRVLVILNLTYPALPEKKSPIPLSLLHRGKASRSTKDHLQTRLNRFYHETAEAFAAFARGELRTKAQANPEGTPPCGAVLRWSLTQETEQTLTIRVEGSIFDGFDTHPIPPDTRTWEKQSGILCKPTEPIAP